MSSVKILHTADLHIGADWPEGTGETRGFEICQTFGRICALCRENGVDICLIAGDLFHSNASAAPYFATVMEHISATADTRFFYVAGNHDPLDGSSPFVGRELPENLKVFATEFEEVTLPDIKVRIKGRSFARPFAQRVDTDPMPQDDYVNILLLHGDFGGSDSRYNPLNADYIKAIGPHYAALGHIHKRTAVERLGNSFIAYPGCPEGQGFDETGPKGVYMGILSGSGAELEFIPTCRRIYAKERAEAADLSAAELAEGICAALKEKYGEGYGDNLYKITLTGYGKGPAPAQVQQLLSERLFYVRVISRMRPRLNLATLAEEKSLKGLFTKTMLEKIDTAEEGAVTELEAALWLGLEAFEAEVKYDEDNIC